MHVDATAPVRAGPPSSNADVAALLGHPVDVGAISVRARSRMFCQVFLPVANGAGRSQQNHCGVFAIDDRVPWSARNAG